MRDAYDLLLLFRADVAIWEKACATTLHDACGFLTVGRDSRRCLAGEHAGFFDCPRSAAGMGMLCSTGKPRGREPERTRHLHGLAGRCKLPSRGRSVERASLNFHAACAGNDTAPFRTPTCQLPGVNFPDVKEPWSSGREGAFGPWLGGLLNNEVQFPAQSAALLEALDRAFVGVGVVTVDDDGKDTAAEDAHAVASASAARRCRALQIAAQLGVEHNRKSLAAWEFEIRASVGTRVTVPRVIVGRHPNDNRPTADGRSDFGGLRVPTAAAWSYSLRGGFADPWRPIRRLPLRL